MILKAWDSLFEDALQLFFPRSCPGCGEALPSKKQVLCVKCLMALPRTGFASIDQNPAERIFAGRCRADRVHAEFYFSKGHTVQRLIHALKYEGDRQAGIFLGRCIGQSLRESERFRHINLLLPLPLFAGRKRARGYNQAAVICRGISEILDIPMPEGVLIREKATETQTRKDRAARWKNVENSFVVKDPGRIRGAQLLLVDDVITTGATLEACCSALEQAGPAGISMAAAALAVK